MSDYLQENKADMDAAQELLVDDGEAIKGGGAIVKVEEREDIPKKRHRGGVNGGGELIPIEKLVEYRLKQGLKYKDIAKLLGCTISNVCNRLAAEGLLVDVDHVARARKARADILTMKGMQIVEHLTESKLSKAGVRDLAIAFNIMHQAERLETGKSTANVAYADLIKAHRDEEQELMAIEAEISARDVE